MAGKSNRSQFLDKSAFAGISPIAKRNKGATGLVDDTIIGGDADSFMTRSFFNVSSAAAPGAPEKDALQVSMELKLLEAQNRIRSLSAETRKRKEADTDNARDLVRLAEAERVRETERSKAAQLSTLNRSLAEDLEQERSKSSKLTVANSEIVRLREEARSNESVIAQLRAELANAAAENRKMALQKGSQLQAGAGGGVGGGHLSRASDAGEAHVLRVELERKNQEIMSTRTRLRTLDEVQSSNEQLRSHVQELEVALARRGLQETTNVSSLQLREENAALKQKVARMQQMSAQLSKCESELEMANRTLAKWKVVISDEYPSLEHVQDAIASLRGQVNTLKAENSTLLESNRAMEQRIRQNDAQVTSLSGLQKQATIQNEQLRMQAARDAQEIALLKEAVQGSQFVLDAFNKEGASFGNYDVAKSQRISQLEELLAKKTTVHENLQSELKTTSEALEASLERIALLESRLVEGEFNPATLQVLHVRQNPLLGESGNVTQRLAKLEEETLFWKKRYEAAKQAGTTTVEIEKLKKDNVKLSQRAERIRSFAETKINEFREIVVLLFGYQVNVEFDAHTYTLTPLPVDKTRMLKFVKTEGSGLQLFETQYALSLPEEFTQYLSKYDSVPGFLSAITLAGIEK